MRFSPLLFLFLTFEPLLSEIPPSIDAPSNVKHPSIYNIPVTPLNPDEKNVIRSTLPLYFITSNAGKFAEVRELLPNVKNLSLDLPEIQSVDPREIIYAKLQEALKYQHGRFIVEDTSLYLDALNGLPGPLIKWFELKLGNQGIVHLVRTLGNDRAEAVTFFGYADGKDIRFFEGRLKGRIVPIRGDFGFGWDPIFQPEGHTKTLAEMSPEEKNMISMRKNALEKLKDYLYQQRAE